jgi:phosphomannomutase
MISVAGVRGIVGDGLTPDVVGRWGAAFGTLLGRGALVLVGRDPRGSGPVIEDALVAALRGVGCHVGRLGIVPTPTIQLAVEETEAAGGVAVTASHNPLPWNALKFIRGDGLFLTAEEGTRLRGLAEGPSVRLDYVGHEALGRDAAHPDAAERHVRKILSLPYIDAARIARRGFRVVVDCGNGAGSVVTPRLLERLGAEVVRLYCEPDGRFPRHAEPRPEHLGDLVRAVREARADLGLAHDPDADRIVFVTGSGRALAEEDSLAIACEEMLSRNPGGVVVTNLSTSQMIDEIAARHGGRVERTPVGEANVAHRMRASRAVIGGEGNGGVIQPLVHLARDGSAAAALALECLAAREASLDDVVSTLPRFAMSKREFPVRAFEPEALRRRLETRFGRGAADASDGIKLTWDKRWVHVRGSGTEPIVRVIAETPTEQETDALVREAAACLAGGAREPAGHGG